MPQFDLTPEQAQLILQIIVQLDKGAVTWDGNEQQCKYCNGEQYTYSFEHNATCIVSLIQQLRRTMLD